MLALVSSLVIGQAAGQTYTFTHLAGPPGGIGWFDGAGSAASFEYPTSVAVDASGFVYVADQGNHRIRKVSPSGVVTSLAGSGRAESLDGQGAGASFNSPAGVAVDSSGNVYVAERDGNRIRKISASAVVTTLAGSGARGNTDGKGASASFNSPTGVAVDAAGFVYVADKLNNRIRKISPDGDVTTFSVGGYEEPWVPLMFYEPAGVAVDAAGNVYVADSRNHRIRKVTADGVVSTIAGNGTSGQSDGTGTYASFARPNGVAVDAAGNVFVADSNNGKIRAITPSGVVTTFAGSGAWSSVDGSGGAAAFADPYGVAVDAAGNVYVAEHYGHKVRKVTSSGQVSTLAGSHGLGAADGVASAATFSRPAAVAVDGLQNVYVADSNNNKIRKISADGTVTALAGSGETGHLDGPGPSATFNNPNGVAADTIGNVFVADAWNSKIRRIDPSGAVTTFAGSGEYGGTDGPGAVASFTTPWGVGLDRASGILYVAEGGSIRSIDPAGLVTTIAGSVSGACRDGQGSDARFERAVGVAADGTGNVYVSDEPCHTIRKVSPGRLVTTFAGLAGTYGNSDGGPSAARLAFPRGVAVGQAGEIYVADTFNNEIRKVTPEGFVTTVAGSGGHACIDGTGRFASFHGPYGVAVTSDGRIVVADTDSNAIRIGSPGLDDAATIDAAVGPVGVPRQLDVTPVTSSSWTWRPVKVPSGSSATLSSTTVRSPLFTPDVADEYVFQLIAVDGAGKQGITYVTLTATAACTPPAAPVAASNGPVCEGDTLLLSTAPVPDAAYSWTGPNGFTSSERLPSISPATLAAAGTYHVTVSVDGCVSAGGSTEVTLRSRPATPVVAAPEAVVLGGSFVASVPPVDGVGYVWSVSGGTIAAGQGTREVSVTADQAGKVVVSVVESSLSSSCASGAGAATVAVKATASSLLFHPVTPCRLLDTRRSSPAADAGAPVVAAGEERILEAAVTTRCGLPGDAKVLALNVTAVSPAESGWLALYPAGVSWPGNASLSFSAGRTRGNNTLALLGGTGGLELLNGSVGPVDVVIDVVGYFR